MLYFAYGSNLNHFQMKRRCKDSKFIKKINLKNYNLTFRSKYKAADIEKKKILLFLVDFLKYQKVMKESLIFMKIIQFYTKKSILLIMEKKL